MESVEYASAMSPSKSSVGMRLEMAEAMGASLWSGRRERASAATLTVPER